MNGVNSKNFTLLIVLVVTLLFTFTYVWIVQQGSDIIRADISGIGVGD